MKKTKKRPKNNRKKTAKKKKTVRKKAAKGLRYNDGKLRWRNFPLFLIRPLVEVAAEGEKKYETFNFLKGLTVLDCLDCLHRHLDKFIDPLQSDYDDEPGGTGKHHLAHVAWNALACLYMVVFRPELDDRWRGPEKKHSRK